MDTTATSHTSDPPVPVAHNVQNNDSTESSNHSASTTDAKQAENDRNLKKTWLSLLPVEQVVDIAMKLDELVPRTAKMDVWPQDLRAAVFQTAVARIMESTAKGKAHDALKSLELTDTTQKEKEKEPNVVGNGDAQREERQSAQVEPTPVDKPPSTTTTATTSPSNPPAPSAPYAPPRTETPAARASPAVVPSSNAAVPPLTSSVIHNTPATSTTSYQAAASVSYGYSYPYTTGSYSYQHSANHQPYSYSYASPAPASAGSTSYSPAPPPPPPPLIPATPKPITIVAPDEEEDLPSYEEMLVQALMVHNDPAGVAPKQLFQWMAATYPLQANFRPSASQALQKAFKRGRFEKNKEGKYRLNARWEGGNTSRRTTRRPQSYSKAVTNPSPSSHPPTNTSQYPPQHYSWTYGPGKGKSHSASQSPAPPTPAPPPAPAPAHAPAPQAVMDPEKDLEGATPMENAGGETNFSSEALTDILHIITKNPDGAHTSADGSKNTTDSTASATAMGRPFTVSQLPSDSSSFPTLIQAQTQARDPSAANEYAGQDLAANRAALQGSLALLAAQLAELAGDGSASSVSVPVPEWPTPAEASAVTASASATSALNLLEGFGLDMFGSSTWAGLRGASATVNVEQ